MTNGRQNPMFDEQFINLIVNLAVARIEERIRATRRWAIGVSIALLGLGIAGLNYAEDTAVETVDDRFRESAQSRVSNRIGYLRDATPFIDARPVGLGRTPVTLGTDERLPLALRFDAPGTYRIDAISLDQSLDPVLYLYRQRISGTAVDAVASNGDYGDQNLNSRLDMRLEIDTFYYIEIEELVGNPGVIDILFERIGD